MTSEEQATHDALERYRESGSDLSRPMKIDFFVAVPDRPAGEAFATEAGALGFATTVEQDGKTHEWTCYCTKTLIPTFSAVRAVELRLGALALQHGG